MSRRMGVLALTMAVAAGLSALTAATAGARQSAAFKVAWIYVGPHNDHGWSQAHDAGRLFVQKSLGSKVQTTFKELVPEGPQAAQVIEAKLPNEVDAYRSFVIGLAERVAEAHEEHGEKVSSGERSVLDEIAEALGSEARPSEDE